VQSAGCAPIARAFDEGAVTSQAWQDAATFAAGLRVPKPYGDYLILDIVRRSGGVALALSDEKILDSLLDWAKHEGTLLLHEGAAATAADICPAPPDIAEEAGNRNGLASKRGQQR